MAKAKKYAKWDFEGWATRYGVKCADGETIAHGAFQNMDGVIVPLVDDHARGYVKYLDAIIGNAYLEHRDEGVYSYITFNTDPGHKTALLRRKQVEHGDIQKLSIKANGLSRKDGSIVRGIIRDLSIVAAGANPGAYIQPAVIEHGDGYNELIEDEAYICFEDGVVDAIEHSDSAITNVAGLLDAMSAEQREFFDLGILAGNLIKGENVEHADEEEPEDEDDDDDDYDDDDDDDSEDDEDDDDDDDDDDSEDDDDDDSEDDDDYDDDDSEDDDDDDSEDDDDEDSEDDDDDDSEDDDDDDEPIIEHSNESGGRRTMSVKANNFKTNGDFIEQGDFDGAEVYIGDFLDTLHHSGTGKQACIEHGVTNITDLYDQPTAVNPEPLIINSPQGWVKSILGGVKKVPFTKIKSLWTDLSAFEGQHRALGYPVLGETKVAEQLEILNRITDCTWIYKRQTLDRDVLFQITSFNFLQWMQAEMGMMMNQELARAILIGDGRLSNSAFKIKETSVRPIAFDSDVWTIPHNMSVTATADDALDELIKLRSSYQGRGTPTLYVSGDQVSAWLVAKNSLGERLYKGINEVASLLRCQDVIEVPQIGVTKNSTGKEVRAIMVNMADYALSLPTGSSALKDSRFDLDINKETYLLEWLVGGALITPKSAICLTQDAAS